MEAPLVVIVGPTASGKTSLAIRLAKKFGGEIICADSRTIYKGVNIGTAKPTKAEQGGVPHWGIDLVDPNEQYSAADFKQYTLKKISEIRSRGRVPFLVGGTGLYVDGVILDYSFGDKADSNLRQKLERMTLEELQNYCLKNNIELPENNQNKRYVMRAIERNGQKTSSVDRPLGNTIVVGITTDKSELMKRIRQRFEQMFKDGVVKEAKALGESYGWNAPALTGNIYRFAKQYLDSDLTKDEFMQNFVQADWRLAKRQLTWFKRREFIKWFSVIEAEEFLASYLAELNKS